MKCYDKSSFSGDNQSTIIWKSQFGINEVLEIFFVQKEQNQLNGPTATRTLERVWT